MPAQQPSRHPLQPLPELLSLASGWGRLQEREGWWEGLSQGDEAEQELPLRKGRGSRERSISKNGSPECPAAVPALCPRGVRRVDGRGLSLGSGSVFCQCCRPLSQTFLCLLSSPSWPDRVVPPWQWPPSPALSRVTRGTGRRAQGGPRVGAHIHPGLHLAQSPYLHAGQEVGVGGAGMAWSLMKAQRGNDPSPPGRGGAHQSSEGL